MKPYIAPKSREASENRKVSIPCNICEEHLSEVTCCKITNNYKKGQIIFYEGTEPTGMYCVVSGSVKCYKKDENGKHTVIGLAAPGDLLGYHSLFLSELYPATAEAIEESSICYLDKKTFFKILKKYPDTALNIMSTLGKELEETEERIVDVANKSIRQRLAKLFLELKEKYGKKTKKGVLLDISMTRKEMAQLVGTTTESMIRLISEFKREHLIQANGRKIILTALPKLSAIARLTL